MQQERFSTSGSVRYCSSTDQPVEIRLFYALVVVIVLGLALYHGQHLRVTYGQETAAPEVLPQMERAAPAGPGSPTGEALPVIRDREEGNAEGWEERMAPDLEPGEAVKAGIGTGGVSVSYGRAAREYIERFAPVAQAEMRKYGIPASVTLAQGLLESRAGTSKLVRATNNHFGIKCQSKKCKQGHCKNFGDDHHKDFFRVYKSAWASYRAHSEFLKGGSRYRGCFECGNDPWCWAAELQRAGYATSGTYARDLVATIETFNLKRFDR